MRPFVARRFERGRKRLAEGAGGRVEYRLNMRESVQLACLLGMALCGGLSLFPFRFAQRWKSWSLYLPVAAILLYALYEFALPNEVDVRGMMRFILPLQLFIWLNGMAKVLLLTALMPKAGGSRRRLSRLPQRRYQLAIELPLLLGCGFWGWMVWI